MKTKSCALNESQDNIISLFANKTNSWNDVKKHIKEEFDNLGENQISFWLSTFDRPFEEFANQVVAKAASSILTGFRESNLRPPYEPHLFESLIKSCAPLLDRCLASKRDMAELEIAGIKVALDYLSYRKLRPITDELEMCALQDKRANNMHDAMEKAAQAYTAKPPGLDTPVANGLREQALGSAADYEELKLIEERRRNLIKNKGAITDDMQTAMFSRYTTPGNAQNFAERYTRARRLFQEDLSESYRKIYSACLGARQCFRIHKFPKIDVPLFEDYPSVGIWCSQFANFGDYFASDILDALVLWTRDTMRDLERIAQYESEDTITLPLNQYWLSDLYPDPNQPLSSSLIKQSMDAVTGNGQVSFYLIPQMLPFHEKYDVIRLIGVGISVSGYEHLLTPFTYHKQLSGSWPIEIKTERDFNSRKAEVEKAAKFSATEMNKKFNAIISFPNLMVGEIFSYERLPMIYNNLGYERGDNSVEIKIDPACRNVKPFEGLWKIEIDKRALIHFGWDSGDPQDPTHNLSMTRNTINGLFLHLRLRLLPKGISI
ncbi:hypothetical protein [Pseudomonas oryzicola]|uniref:Uncharacterized protein n=1 Tax=Pseudomonas oryzicola TaxID=485876 RepID=A0ABS6QBM6_9PSED|nr:hypothetical protein [Pseudomonas oryzicola]MBV4491595.1 hypothetical protein [Pseudomonas oryzicola]